MNVLIPSMLVLLHNPIVNLKDIILFTHLSDKMGFCLFQEN